MSLLFAAMLAVVPVQYDPPESAYGVGRAYVREHALKACIDDYPNDLVMRSTCIDMHIEGAGKFFAVRDRAAGRRELLNALAKCLGDYTNSTTKYRDWMMIGVCAEMQEEAAKKLGL